MTWDLFLSYGTEDSEFARQLARSLQDEGLRVWFAEFVLQAGDSLRRSINAGLRDSDFGVVILSPHFFKKEWTLWELDGLTAREHSGRKMILPVWYNVSVEEVRRYSPSLVDKLSVEFRGSVESVAIGILKAIYAHRATLKDWIRPTLLLPDGSEAVILPLRPLYSGQVACIGRYPVTNEQYQRFVSDTGYSVPSGETYRDGGWRGPFHPWEDEHFRALDKPVVCVSYHDAREYCHWATTPQFEFLLPSGDLWDYAATGTFAEYGIYRTMRAAASAEIHHRSDSPAAIDRSGKRENRLGISDMLGNVWEWVGGGFTNYQVPYIARILPLPLPPQVELRGGSFLDDLDKVRPIVHSSSLKDGLDTRHSDLGFRVAVRIHLEDIPKETRLFLEDQPSFADEMNVPMIRVGRVVARDDDF